MITNKSKVGTWINGVRMENGEKRVLADKDEIAVNDPPQAIYIFNHLGFGYPHRQLDHFDQKSFPQELTEK